MPAIFVVLMFFLIPADPKHLKSSPMLLDWKSTVERVSWGVILLLGGGFAMAKGCEESGLSVWIGNKLAAFSTLQQPLITVIMCSITLVLTELTSNTATCTILLPVVKQMVSACTPVCPLFACQSITVCDVYLADNSDGHQPFIDYVAGDGQLLVRLHAAGLLGYECDHLRGGPHEEQRHGK